jgi:hypothetical protein
MAGDQASELMDYILFHHRKSTLYRRDQGRRKNQNEIIVGLSIYLPIFNDQVANPKKKIGVVLRGDNSKD